jgi:hypothetical protein
MHGKQVRLVLLVVALMLSSVPVVSADAEANAYVICDGLKSTGDASQCTVKGSGLTVDAVINTKSEEAEKICFGVAGEMARYGMSFNGKWHLRIFSPYSDEKPIAVCALR